MGPVLFTPNDSDNTNAPDNTDIPQYDDDEILEDDVELIDPDNPEPPLEDPGRFDPDEDTTDTTRIIGMISHKKSLITIWSQAQNLKFHQPI